MSARPPIVHTQADMQRFLSRYTDHDFDDQAVVEWYNVGLNRQAGQCDRCSRKSENGLWYYRVTVCPLLDEEKVITAHEHMGSRELAIWQNTQGLLWRLEQLCGPCNRRLETAQQTRGDS